MTLGIAVTPTRIWRAFLLHDGVGYVLPGKGTINVGIGARSGSWSNISSLQAKTPVTKAIFSLWLSHGVHPANATYQYIVVPGTEATRLANYAEHIPVRILANTTDMASSSP